jgi:hypothetical protein
MSEPYLEFRFLRPTKVTHSGTTVARSFDRADIINIVGAPSLRFVQGRVRCRR